MLRRNLKLKTFVIVSIAGVVIIAGLLVGTVRLIDLAIPSYRDEVASLVGDRINRPVTIGAMDMTWGWHGPVMQLNQAAILDSEAGNPIVSLKSLALHFGIMDLLRLRLQPDGISIVGPQISAYRDADGKLHVRGIQASDTPLDWRDIVQKLNQFQFIRVTEGELFWNPTPDKSNPIHLHSIALNLVNQDTRHRLSGQLQLPQELGDRAEFSALFIGDADSVNLDNLRAHTYLKGEILDFTAITKATGAVSADVTAPKSGRNNLEIWSDWREGDFAGARVSVTGGPAAAAGNDPQGRLLPPKVGMDFSVSPVTEGFRINLDAVRGQSGYQPKMGGNALVNLDKKTASAQFQDIPASLLGGWLPLIDDGATWQTSGVIEQVRLGYDGQQQPAQASGEITFTGLGFNNPERGLQANGLNGTLSLASDGGRLRLSGADGKLTWAKHINGELPLDTLAGKIDWRQEDSGWHIQAEKLRWRGADAEITANGELRIPASGSPEVDIKAQIQSQDLPRLLAYLPQDPELPNPRLREWLPKAILGGSMENGKVVLKGPLDAFPYTKGGGTFEVNADFKNAELDYKPGWPLLTDGNAKLNLVGKTLKIQADHAKMLGINIGPAVATIPNVEEAILGVDGTVKDADASTLLSFLSNSPLREKFGELTQILEIDGQADLALDLSIPLKPDLGDVRSDGRITLKQSTLSHRVLPEPIENIHGELAFTRQGVSATGLRGDLLGLPLVADLNPSNTGALSINASALIRMPRDYDALRRFVPAAVVDQIGGEGVWHATLDVAPDGRVSDLALRSDLQGISLGFPAPLHKEADGPLPIRVEVGGERERIHIDLADRLDMVLRSQDGRVSSMNLIFGDTGEAPSAGDGIWLGGTIVTLDALGWQDFVSALGSGGEKGRQDDSKTSLALRGADLRIQETLFGGQRMNRVQLQLNPLTTGGGWTANITGPGAQGDIRYLSAPPGTSGARALLNGSFARIELEPDANTRPESEDRANPESAQTPSDPSQLPVTDITVDNIKLDGIDIGQLNLQARAIPGGLDLTRLEISGGRLDINATGQWQLRNNLTEAKLTADVKGEGLDSLFRTLGYTANIRAKDTDINADLNIAPNPDGLSPAALNGKMKIKFDDGTLISVDPGAGRVLGLFNFYALPRRLLFDFRDVVNEGLAFDSIRGSFNIDSGVARSDNVRIRMPSATVRVEGEVDLAKRTYDQRVSIAPKVSSGVAVAGTVLGGPAVGAILLLAQKLLEKPIENLSAINYHLVGDWQDPEIKAVTADERTPTNEDSTQ